MDGESVYTVVVGFAFGLPAVLAWSGHWRSWHRARGRTPGDPTVGRHLPLTLLPLIMFGCIAAGVLEVLPTLALVLGLLAFAFGMLAVWDAITNRVPRFLEPRWARREHS